MKIYVVYHIVESNEFCCNIAKSTDHGYMERAFTRKENAEKFCDWIKGQCKTSKNSGFAIKEIELD